MKNNLKETGLNETELKQLKETFKKQYAEKKGWDVKKLTTEQLLEIHEQDGYKKAGLLFS